MSISTENLRLILGLKLKNLRQGRGLSLKDLAERAGLSISYLSEIEKGKKYPKPDKLIGLSRVLEVPFDELVSVAADDQLHTLTETLRSPFFTEFPFELFGLETQDLVSLFSGDPARAGALFRTFLEIGQMYDVRVEHFLFAALRSYQLLHDNYFSDIEDVADAFRRESGAAQLDGAPEAVLRRVLERAYGYEIDETTLGDSEALQGFRSVYADGVAPRLYLNPRLLPGQRAFVFAREIGYRVLGLEERALTSSWLKVESFEQVLNNFKASYFAGAVLIDRERLLTRLSELFASATWDESAFLSLLTGFNTTPETLLYRIGQLLPHMFGFQEFFFLRINDDPDQGTLHLGKVFNRSHLALPQGFWLDEHYCRRWSALRLLQRMDHSSDVPGVRAHAQRSRFTLEGESFFEFTVARRLAPPGHARTSVTLGFRLDDAFKSRVRFWNDPGVPEERVNVTCERCPLPGAECAERVAKPRLLDVIRDRETRARAVENLLAGRKG